MMGQKKKKKQKQSLLLEVIAQDYITSYQFGSPP